jgi:hypothetical protein
VSAQGSPELKKLEALSRSVLLKSPLSAAAMRHRAVWFGVSGKLQQQSISMGLAERISRRDLLTHIWFIEANVANDNVAAILKYYDLALRTEAGSGLILFPILTKALASPDIRIGLASQIRKSPPWLFEALNYIIPHSDDPTYVADTLIMAGRIPDSGQSQQINSMLIASLVSKGEYDWARRYYLSLKGANPAVLSTMGFDYNSVDKFLAPLTWGTISNAQAGGSFPDSSSDHGIFLAGAAGPNGHGLVARKLSFISPGIYSLTTKSNLDGASDSRSFLRITCLSERLGAEIVNLNLKGPINKSVFTMPKECRVQFVDIDIDSGSGQSPSALKVYSLVLKEI